MQPYMQSIEHFYPLLSKPSNIVVTCHQKPDGDAMGSSLGLYHFLTLLNHQVTVISPTNWADFLNWMPGVGSVLNYESNKQKAQEIIDCADILFCLDFNILHRTKHLEKPLTDAKCIKVLIDHHEQPQEEAFDYGVSNTAKSSTCEMVYDFIMTSGYGNLLNIDIATCLYTGVMTDTGSFRFPSTTASVHRMVANLKDLGLQHSDIHSNIFDCSLENKLRFTGFALVNRMEVLYEYNTALMHVYSQDIKRFDIKTGDTEGLVNYLLTIKGIRFGAIVMDRDEERKWSFRSKGNFDVNTFARKHFEGGGHFNAAGGGSKATVDETVKKFKQVLPDYYQQLK
ncbi:DHH family phosphoesterase [Parasediminibacterium sp. JCM 36343]|uniref:DHH family phosphoesterase n=1 Tax=Parasediminibacterium sp. JCM 36343 TaxID=3374279 RepID=UPI00397C3325